MSWLIPKSKLFRNFVVTIAISLCGFCSWYYWPQDLIKPQFTISEKTTFFTVPIDGEGYVDYQKALNEHAAKGATKDNNVMALFMQVIGPGPQKGALSAEFYERLGIIEPPLEGKYLITLGELARKKEWSDLTNIDTLDVWQDAVTRRAWTKDQYPRIVEWLEVNEQPVKIAEQAAQRTHYYAPMVFPVGKVRREQSMLGVLIPCIQKFRDIGNVLIARSMLHLGNKEYQKAWNDLMTTMKLGRLAAKGPTLIELLVGYALQNMAYDGCLALANDPDVPQAFLKQCLESMSQLPSLATEVEKIRLGERVMALDLYLMFHRHGPGMAEAMAGGKIAPSNNQAVNSWRKADWDSSLIKINNWYDELAKIAGEPDRAKRQQKYRLFHTDIMFRKQKIDAERSSLWTYLESPSTRVERMGEIILVMITPAIDKVQQASDRCEQRGELARLALALAWYHRQHKKYPPSLESLAPTFLPTIPNDLFTGKPLTYQLTEKGYLLYSFDQNEMDDDGRNEWSDPRGDDITVQIPLPPLPKKDE